MYQKITISGQICTGKTTLFWDLARTLKWPTFSASQFFRDYSRTHHVSLQKAEEQNQNLTREVDLGMKDMLLQDYHIIVEGWMAGIMARGIPNVLQVLLTCSDKERTQRFAKREGIPLPDAEQKIREREESWIEKLKKIYNRTDFFDPTNYNLVIDTTHKTPDGVKNTVLTKL